MKKVLWKKSVIIFSVIVVIISVNISFITNTFAGKVDAVGIEVSKDTITIDNAEKSEFIDVVAKFEDGTTQNVTIDAEWKAQNPDVAFADEGRILAKGKGETSIDISFDGKSKQIKVKVLNDAEPEPVNLMSDLIETEESNNSGNLLTASSTSERSNIITRASNMASLSWIPKKNLTGWKARTTFKAGVTYKGIPYSQTAYQKNYSGFIAALKYSAFYNKYTRSGIVMPRYGSDCSGFTSFAWNISRHTTTSFMSDLKNGTFKRVGSYNIDNPSLSDLKKSYASMKPGDAFLSKEHKHIFIMQSRVSGSNEFRCFEQTPPDAGITIWTYTQLANSKYRPISKF